MDLVTLNLIELNYQHLNFTIINATPGLTTNEQILELLENYPNGLTAKQLSQLLNRPVSMIQICLKLLVICQKLRSHEINMRQVYYLTNTQK
ncbi:hypothetical protein CY0110_03754 [Crocosphaera chwakensis CCY0110]|uniref:MarR family transcriptional regulator n=1 Tax=Crocosphaera chwakensis CCY0110 TaxID=391612 RepID=A3IKG4_9CHRO|nr:hypothetical protein CY0110_03754 [Crocosphaera chwakensis CCY0110]